MCRPGSLCTASRPPWVFWAARWLRGEAGSGERNSMLGTGSVFLGNLKSYGMRSEGGTACDCILLSPPLFFLGLISLFIFLYSPSSIMFVFARYLIKNISQPQSQIRHYNNWQFVPPLTSRKEGHWVDEQIAHNRWKQREGFFSFQRNPGFSMPAKSCVAYSLLM